MRGGRAASVSSISVQLWKTVTGVTDSLERMTAEWEKGLADLETSPSNSVYANRPGLHQRLQPLHNFRFRLHSRGLVFQFAVFEKV